VRKRNSLNYLLWPEQVGPRRAIPFELAPCCFAIGIVSAVSVYIVVTYFLRPISIQQVARESAVEHVPINMTATAAVTAVEPLEPVSRTRSRRPVTKVTLPTIGTRAIEPGLDIDGRGEIDSRGGDALEGDTPVAALTAPPASQPITLIEGPKPADKPLTEASSRKAKHVARERRAKLHRHRTVRKKRERPSLYASGYRNGPYFGYGGRVTYGYGGYGGVYAWPQW
jgi:hypothetical protein